MSFFPRTIAAFGIAPLAVGALCAGCASYPAPVQHLADAEAAARTAQESGADAEPQAQLHLRVAQEEITQAKQLMANGDNERADSVLTRARGDAELALAQARTIKAQAAAQRALDRVAQMQSAGATTSATTTVSTTSGSVQTPPVAPMPPATTSTTTTTTQTSGGKP